MLSPKEIMESEEYQLDRQATAFKKAGDWDGAIAALRQRKSLLGLRWDDLKLAKYLQQAGRFDEAMAEVQWLLDQAPAYCQALFGHQPQAIVQCQEVGYRARLHAGAALICKRAKAVELQAHHQAQADRLGEEALRLRPLSRQVMKDRENV